MRFLLQKKQHKHNEDPTGTEKEDIITKESLEPGGGEVEIAQEGVLFEDIGSDDSVAVASGSRDKIFIAQQQTYLSWIMKGHQMKK